MRCYLRAHAREAAFAGGQHGVRWENKKRIDYHWIDTTVDLLRYFNASFHPRAHTKAIDSAVLTARGGSAVSKRRLVQVESRSGVRAHWLT